VSMYAIGLRLAREECSSAWTQESWVQVIYVFVFGFLPSLFNYLLVYTYYRQATDPSHSAYMISVPRSSRPQQQQQQRQHANGGYALVPNNVSDAPYAGIAQGETNSRRSQRSARQRTNANANRAVEVGTTAAAVVAPTATRGINRAHRPPALQAIEPPVFTPQRGVLMQSAAALTSWLSPGPPTYGVNAGRQNLMGNIALSCSSGSLMSARYGKLV